MLDRRCEARTQTAIAAMIIGDGVNDPCTIIELSDRGARVRVDVPSVLPHAVLLRMTEFAVTLPAQVVWGNGNEYGMRFRY
jgi:hypothetical protein